MPYKDPAKQREYNNKWTANRQARIRKWLENYKIKNGCVDCGYNENPDALEFDHIGNDKFGSVSSLVARGMKRVQEEISKCEIRCANCHAIITAKRRRSATSVA